MIKTLTIIACLTALSFTSCKNEQSKEEYIASLVEDYAKNLPLVKGHVTLDSVIYIGGLDIGCYMTITTDISNDIKESLKKTLKEDLIMTLKYDKNLSAFTDMGCIFYYYVFDASQQLIMECTISPES